MQHHTGESQPSRSRRGQALTEFALTAPLLLLLIFGIIEFGRAFQSWVTIQNAARAAARFASVGAVNWELFVDPDTSDPRDPQEILDYYVPCVGSADPGGADQRGSLATMGDVDILEGGKESFFATWYDGTDCEPSNEDHQQYRRDILRLISVMYEARDSLNSIAVEPNEYINRMPNEVRDLLYSTWTQPDPGNHTEAAYLLVQVCSSRSFIDVESNAFTNSYDGSRFVTIRNQQDLQDVGGTPPEFPIPYCMLNENPPLVYGGGPRDRILNNAGQRWMDVGGPGDRVTVFVRLNHPLITPISQDPYITMEARRSAVNESFRAPRAVGALQRSLPPGTNPEELLNLTRTAEAQTPEITPEPVVPTDTPPPTPIPPFDCTKLSVGWANTPFIGSEFYMSFANDNAKATQLIAVDLAWGETGQTPIPEYPSMWMQASALDNEVHWIGTKPNGVQRRVQFNTGSPGWQPGAYNFIAAADSSIWSGVFTDGPSNLGAYLTLWDFEGTFTFDNPDGEDCTMLLVKPQQPEPTDTPVPTAGPSPTPTPNCATAFDIDFRRGGWDTFDGSYYFELRNRVGVPATIVGIDLVWPDRQHPDIVAGYNANVPNNSGTYHYLARVAIGEALTDPNLQVMFRGATNQDRTGNRKTTMPYDRATRAGRWNGANVTNGSEGTWVGNAVVPANSTVRLYLDFDGNGVAVNDLRRLGFQEWHFHAPRLNILCERGGSGGGGGGQPPEGDISLPLPSPTATFTPRPSNTPGPTYTRTNTPRPVTPTRTNTPRPATPTPTPRVATQTPSRTPFGYIPPPTNKPGE